MSRSSPFAEFTASAHRAEFAGWDLPADFGDWQAEYRAARDSAAVFDCSNHGNLEVSGPDAPSFLTNLSTNDIANLPLGAGGLTYFLNPRAKVLFQAVVYHVLLDGNRHALMLDVTPGYHEKLLQHLDRFLISEQVELKDQSLTYGQLHLAGPEARVVLERALGEPIPDLGPFMHMERTIGSNLVCHVRRHDVLGVPGYDIVCLNARAEGLWRALTMNGAKAAGQTAFEVLRVEAGTPIYGKDIDENRFVMEVGGASDAVCYTKGCFVGQEPIVMARDRAGFVNRAFLGLLIRDGGPLSAGTQLYRDTEEVGIITSSVVSPDRGAIALGYIRRGHQDPGTILMARTEKGDTEVEVAPLPIRR